MLLSALGGDVWYVLHILLCLPLEPGYKYAAGGNVQNANLPSVPAKLRVKHALFKGGQIHEAQPSTTHMTLIADLSPNSKYARHVNECWNDNRTESGFRTYTI